MKINLSPPHFTKNLIIYKYFFSIILTLLITILNKHCYAADSPVTVQALYDSESSIPGVLIPIRASVSSNTPLILQNISLSGAGYDVCRVMRDPFIENVILLKCLKEASVNLNLEISNLGTVYQVTYGPVKIKHPTQGHVVIPTPTPPDVSTDITLGRQLYSTYCISCHNSADQRGKSEAAIVTALRNIPAMNGSGSRANLLWLSDDTVKVRQLSTFLKNL